MRFDFDERPIGRRPHSFWLRATCATLATVLFWCPALAGAQDAPEADSRYVPTELDLGSTAATSGVAGVAEERFWHSPFGRRVAPETGEFLEASEDFDVRPRFASHVTDGQAPNLGTFGASFVHMRGREYDPVIGRFLSQDPMTPVGIDSSGWNPYAYVLNNPSTLIDPSGFGPFDVLEDSVTSATSSLDLVNQGVALQYLTAALGTRPAVAHLQAETGDFYTGLFTGLGIPGLQPDSFGDNVARERAFYNGQLIGSAIGITADLLMVFGGAMMMYTGELPAVLLGLVGSVIGPEGGVGGVAVGVIVGAPVFVVGAGFVIAGGAVMPFHVSNLNDAISNLRRMESVGSGGGRTVRSRGRPAPDLRNTRAGPRLHGEIPHRGDLRRMSTNDLVELRETTRISLRTRLREMQQLGDRGGARTEDRARTRTHEERRGSVEGARTLRCHEAEEHAA